MTAATERSVLTIQRLFEAFFTTKPTGKGTGLGLGTCQTIVQQSGGYIAVYSEVGQGTTFKIYLPRVKQPRDVAPPPEVSKRLPRGTETLLVVEEDLSLRHLARGVLEAQGYVTGTGISFGSFSRRLPAQQGVTMPGKCLSANDG